MSPTKGIFEYFYNPNRNQEKSSDYQPQCGRKEESYNTQNNFISSVSIPMGIYERKVKKILYQLNWMEIVCCLDA